jgi:flagellar biosynthesis chaperone FliJ
MSGYKLGASKAMFKEDERWESITFTLATILDKFDNQGARLTTLSDNYDTLKANQGHLHTAVNNVQSKQLQLAASAQGATHEQQRVESPPKIIDNKRQGWRAPQRRHPQVMVPKVRRL